MATLGSSYRKPPIDGVPTPVGCNSAPIGCNSAPVGCNSAPVEPDRREGFKKLVENDWFIVLKVVYEYCSQELIDANANETWWRLDCTVLKLMA